LPGTTFISQGTRFAMQNETAADLASQAKVGIEKFLHVCGLLDLPGSGPERTFVVWDTSLGPVSRQESGQVAV